MDGEFITSVIATSMEIYLNLSHSNIEFNLSQVLTYQHFTFIRISYKTLRNSRNGFSQKARKPSQKIRIVRIIGSQVRQAAFFRSTGYDDARIAEFNQALPAEEAAV